MSESHGRPSSPSTPPPEKKSSKGVLVLLILLFLGGSFAIYKWMLPSETQPQPSAPAPEPPERQTSLVKEEPVAPPPLPETAVPTPDAGTAKTRRGGGGGGACSGEINAAAVRGYARERSAALRSCYERRLKVNNMLQGRIVLKMTVQPSGNVSGTSVVQDSVHDREVTSCVRQAVAQWRLPAPTGGCVHVEYPFQFSPSQN